MNKHILFAVSLICIIPCTYSNATLIENNFSGEVTIQFVPKAPLSKMQVEFAPAFGHTIKLNPNENKAQRIQGEYMVILMNKHNIMIHIIEQIEFDGTDNDIVSINTAGKINVYQLHQIL
jgi:hypothetical protein